jgi:hypothetical protein
MAKHRVLCMMVQQSGHVVSPCALLVLPDTNPAAAHKRTTRLSRRSCVMMTQRADDGGGGWQTWCF